MPHRKVAGDVPCSLRNLCDDDIAQLTRIFSYPLVPPDRPSPSTSELAARRETLGRMIRSLPSHLLAPIPWRGKVVSALAAATALKTAHVPAPMRGPLGRSLSRMASSSSSSAAVPRDRPFLCATHAGLDARLVHAVFGALVREVTVRMGVFVAHFPALPRAEQDVVHALRALQALWLPDRAYRRMALDRWTRQADGCEACVLARVGADDASLMALRAAVLSRSRAGREPPRFWRWVEAWARCSEGSKEVLRASEERGAALKQTRRAIHRAEKEGRRKEEMEKETEGRRKEEMEKETEEEGGEDESDPENFEEDIIAYYAALPSMNCLPLTDEAGPEKIKTPITPEEGFVFPPFRPSESRYASAVTQETNGESEPGDERQCLGENADCWQNTSIHPALRQESRVYSSARVPIHTAQSLSGQPRPSPSSRTIHHANSQTGTSNGVGMTRNPASSIKRSSTMKTMTTPGSEALAESYRGLLIFHKSRRRSTRQSTATTWSQFLE